MSKAAAAIMIDSDDELSFRNDDDSDFSFDEKDTRKMPASFKKAAGTTKAASSKPSKKSAKAVEVVENVKAPAAVLKEKSVNKSKEKTIEETYQKKTQLEHILLRPDTYIGSVERVSQPMYVWNGEKIIEKEITYTPGLYKIFDEILVNAADNKQRHENTDKIEISINASENKIQVKNNGTGIPIVKHQEHGCYIPTLIFGHLLTGSNFDDEEKKTTGGRNGYGAKLANIFSLEFVVECVDTSRSLKFRQVFRNNMTIAEEPVIRTCAASDMKGGDYVSITFSPDLTRFKMSSLDEDTVALLSKRAFDIAGSMSGRPGKKLSVLLNGENLPIKNFQTYLALYQGIEPPAAFEKDDRWEVGVSASDGVFQQVSFVNSISTTKGGQHVQYIVDQVVKRLMATVAKKNKGGIQIKEAQMKNHLCVFVNCLIDNPAFDSQTKENLTTRKTAFGSTIELSEKFLKQVEKSGVVDKILAFAQFKQRQALSKQGGTKKKRLIGINKLDDANFAGSAKSQECTLILTEGDSAKSLAMSGLSVVGRDYYGVFPLKGKPLNVRDANHTQIMQNEELKNVTEIMGLKHGVKYDETNIKTLRYGHIMIMADQDHDGSHIKGLIINFIHHFWPSLLDVSGFLEQFITPIVKATKSKKVLTFFTIPEYETWKKSLGDDARGWTIKYYKGLGTSTSSEAKEYFSNLDLHDIPFSRLSDDRAQEFTASMEIDEDTKPSALDATQRLVNSCGSDLIQMAFSKHQAADRKLWISSIHNKDTFFDYVSAQKNGGAKFSDFINRELVLFSQCDNLRSIPNLYDGFKPSQRKVMFACFLRNLRNEMKVVQLGGYVSEKSAYHHGETSLQNTIINLAQDYVGSNNINLLTPAGQFGTRRMGGSDAASARYIHTKLEKLARLIYHPDDDALLNYLDDDGVSIEPEFYMPVIPMCLVNGSEGIGTGWSTSIPNFNPRDIISNIRRLIKSEPQEKMVPYYNRFTGVIEEDPKKPGSYTVTGRVERIDDTTLRITELPIDKWTQDYKEFLEGLMIVKEEKEKKKDEDKAKNADKGTVKEDEIQIEVKESKKKEPDITDFKENHTDSTVCFTISATKAKIDQFESEKGGLVGKFKLSTKISTTNMNLFTEESRIEKFDSPEDVLQKFFHSRLAYYEKRKEHLLNIMRRELRMISNKARFVEEVCKGTFVISNRKRSVILLELKKNNYEAFTKAVSKSKASQEASEDESGDEDLQDADLSKGYDYLLGMKLWALTLEKVEGLKKQLEDMKRDLLGLESTPSSALWEKDLAAIEIALDERDQHYTVAAEEECKAQMKNTKRKAVTKGARKPKAKTYDDDHDDDSYGEPKTTKIFASAAKKPDLTTSKQASSSSKMLVDSVPAATSKAQLPAVSRGTALPTKVTSIQDDSDLPLAERMKRKLAMSPPKDAKKKPKSKQEDDDAMIFDSDDFEPASLTPAPMKGKNAVAIKNKVPAKAVAAKVSRTATIDSSFEEDDSVVVEMPPVGKPTGRSVRDRKAVTYTIDLDSEDDSDSNSDSSESSE